jgi:nicotinate dehydrogenase subunit A
MIEIKHNNTTHQIDSAPGAQLYNALRATCGDKSVRYGCGGGHCGACTVLINGQPENSCSTPSWSLENAEITTPSGLPNDPIGKIVLAAFLKEQAAQCGYCINGIMMRLTGLLTQNKNSTDAQITEALSRHLCRCGAHLRIFKAAKSARNQLARE